MYTRAYIFLLNISTVVNILQQYDKLQGNCVSILVNINICIRRCFVINVGMDTAQFVRYFGHLPSSYLILVLFTSIWY